MTRKISVIGMSLALGAIALLTAAGIATSSGAARAAEQPKELSPKVGKALRSAQELAQKQDWEGALAKVQEAEAVADKKPFDEFQTAEILGYVQLKREKYAEAAAAFEKGFTSGLLPPDQTQDRIKLLTQLSLKLKDFPKAVQYAKQGVEATPNPEPATYALLGQSQYLAGDYKAAAETMVKAVDTARKAGKPVEETWLQVEMSGYGQIKDAPGVLSARQQLAIAFPKQEYLEELFKQWRYTEDDDRSVLSLHRLMFELGLLKEAEDYVRLARLSAEAGTPGEAVRVLEQGKAKKIFADEVDQERARRVLEPAKIAAVADRKSVEALKQTTQSRSAEEDVQLGAALLSYEDYAKAAEALQRGLTKGGVKRADQAQILLGQALLKLNQPAEAKAAFESVDAASSLKTVAELWRVYTAQPSPISAQPPPAG